MVNRARRRPALWSEASADLALAWRNVFRHTKRTLITAGALAIGLTAYLAIDSLLSGLGVESERNLIRYETGAVQVIDTEYLAERDERGLDHLVEAADRIDAALQAAGYATALRTVFAADAVVFRDPYPEDGSLPVLAYAIDPTQDGQVYHLSERISAGRYLGPNGDEALLGSWLAEDIGAEPGFPLTLVTRTVDGVFQTIDVEIVGIVDTPNPVVNRAAVVLPLSAAQWYVGTGGAVSEIAIGAPAGADVERLAAEVAAVVAEFPGVRVVDWRELAPDVVAAQQGDVVGSVVILGLVVIIAAVGVGNTMLMATMERSRELGTLRALGMGRGKILRILLFEAGAVGLIGAAVGLVLGAASIAALVYIGIDYGDLLRDADVGYRMTQVIRGAWNPTAFVISVIAGVLIAMVTAVVPALRATKVEVATALRYG